MHSANGVPFFLILGMVATVISEQLWFATSPCLSQELPQKKFTSRQDFATLTGLTAEQNGASLCPGERRSKSQVTAYHCPTLDRSPLCTYTPTSRVLQLSSIAASSEVPQLTRF